MPSSPRSSVPAQRDRLGVVQSINGTKAQRLFLLAREITGAPLNARINQQMNRLFLTLIAALLHGSVYAQSTKVDWVTSVVLKEAAHVEPSRISAAIQRRLTSEDKFAGFEPGDNLVLLRVAGGTAMISLMNAPIPHEELQEVCQYAWYWKTACDIVKGHQAHLLIVLMDTELDKLGSAVLQTKIVAAVIEATTAVAAYWGVNLQPRDTFLKASARVSRTSVFPMLWVNYRLSRDSSGKITLSTRGLKDFGLMEIETKDAPIPGRELFELALGMSEYLITKGPVIGDGDTIGQSPQQRIRVRHAESYWNAGEKVYRIEVGG